ncbi:MAG: MFS transporter, partial [Bacteroidetes bacterium]|nr:MFS transporter [Bacteroidota bacterium]
VALAFAFVKVPALSDPHELTAGNDQTPVSTNKKLIQQRHFVWAVIAQFVNVAAQAGTWSFFINYCHEKMHFSDETSGNYMVLFMGMMTLGRFVGTYAMRTIAPNKILASFALGSILCCLLVAQSLGWTSFIALLFINFFFSIMFPTIFSLGIKNLGSRTQQGSSYISMGVVGGAIMPYLMGKVANHDVASAYYLPIICYVVILSYGLGLYRQDK